MAGVLDDFIASMSGTDAAGLSTVPAADRPALDYNAYAGGLSALGSGLGAVARFMYGVEARQAGDSAAAQLRQNAGQAQASAQRQAADITQQTQLVTSRALAVAAASGGGASDPTVVDLIARDAARGAYLRSVALYGGEDRARALEGEANVRQYEGKVAERNAFLEGGLEAAGGATSLMRTESHGASLFAKFGQGAPTASPLAVGGGDVSGSDTFSWHGGAGGF